MSTVDAIETETFHGRNDEYITIQELLVWKSFSF